MLVYIAYFAVLVLAPIVIYLLIALKHKERDRYAYSVMVGTYNADYLAVLEKSKAKDKTIDELKTKIKLKDEHIANLDFKITELRFKIDNLKEHNQTLLAENQDMKAKLDSVKHQLTKLLRPRCIRCGRFMDGAYDTASPSKICYVCFSDESASLSLDLSGVADA